MTGISDRSAVGTAAIAFGVWCGVGLVLGDVYPFSDLPMYAGLVDRTSGAVPVFLADGVPADVRTFRSLQGLDPDAFRPPTGIPISTNYAIDDLTLQVRDRLDDGPEGPVAVSLGWIVLTQTPEGTLDRQVLLTDSGTAWPD